jgi:hypothetical protein
MKKYAIYVFAALLMFSTTMNAKGKKEKGPSVDVRIEKMATDLSLSATEKANVKALLEKQAAAKKETVAAAGDDKKSKEFKKQMKALTKTQEAELKTLLGDEKYAKYQATKSAEVKPAEKAAE